MAEHSGEAYQSLYRRYRPQRFEDVRGQEHVTTALRNAVRQDRVAHAYLFSGPRGTGKTSTARILAMALNCANPIEGEPDGTCESCIEVRRGSSLDVQELDAASNRRLDEMRDLLSRVALGTRGRWKVYIIDEVHQLTSDAASALLKTLEEPPAHVVFVLATTDPQKVLPTIRSRTQHFEFRLLSADTLGGLLADVNAKAGLGVAPEALDLVVRRGHGSARDALSVLDQVAAAGETEDEVSVVSDVVEALADRDVARVLVALAEGMAAGREPRRLATDLLEHLRNGFLALTARALVQLPDDAAAVAEGQARRLGLAGVVRAMEAIGAAAVEMRDSVDPRVTLEVSLIRIAAPGADTDNAALLARIERLEAQIASNGGVGASQSGERGGVSSPPLVEGPSPERSRPGGGLTAQGSEDDAPSAPSGPDTRPEVAPPDAAPRPVLPRTAAERPARGQRSEPKRDESRPALGAPPPMPGQPSGAAQPRATIGAHRRAAQGGTNAPVPPSGSGTPRVEAGGRRGGDQARPGSGIDASRGAGPPTQSAQDRPTAPPGSHHSPSPDGSTLPSRDELTTAWADRVLPALPARVKAYMAQGRFVDVDSAAVFALPDQGLLSRAEALKAEAESALAAAFGRPVPLRLVLDDRPGAVRRDGPPPVDEDPSSFDMDELVDADSGVISPAQRLLQAFPGAEEVTP